MKKIKVILMLCILPGSLLFYILCYNIGLKMKYVPQDNAYSYSDAIENGDVDFDYIASLLPDASAMIDYGYVNDIEAPITILYYSQIGDDTPSYSIPKGEKIHFNIEGSTKSSITFSGIESIPTNVAGWRLVRPFAIEGMEENNVYMFVKLEELIKIAEKWLDYNPNVKTRLSEFLIKQGIFPTKRNICKYLILNIDRLLYSNGIFFSKDMLIKS